MFYGLGFVLLIRRADCQKQEVYTFFNKQLTVQCVHRSRLFLHVTFTAIDQPMQRKYTNRKLSGTKRFHKILQTLRHALGTAIRTEIFTLHVPRKVRIRGRVHEAQCVLRVCFVFLNSFCFTFRSHKY